jgi:hypothetical protein
VTLDRLDMTANEEGDCISLSGVPLSGNDDPIVVQGCTMRAGMYGVFVDAKVPKDPDHPRPCGHVVIRNNTLVGCGQGIRLSGAVHQVHVVGNRISDAEHTAIDLVDLLPGTRDILVANNTLLRNRISLRILDDGAKGQAFLKCNNIRFQNNLVLAPQQEADLFLLNHRRGEFNNQPSLGDLQALLNSREWRFSHNGREIMPLRDDHPKIGFWIPERPNDRLQKPIDAGSRKLGDANFLRPSKDSPLATAGAGVDDPALPPYIGAVPPEGVEPWDWDKTWKALAH